MAVIDIKQKIIHGKIVYYGPGLCGKTTNLEYINSKVPNTKEMMSLSTEGDRTIFFDFLPMDLGKIRGISTTFKLYTVPGQVRYNLTRKMVLKNVDGVVFVADSQSMMLDSNLESLGNLYENLRELRMDPDDVPVVLQYNKRDLPDLMSPQELDKALNTKGYPVFLASAVKGDGVLETLSKISNIVFQKFMISFGSELGPPATKKIPIQSKFPKAAARPAPTTKTLIAAPAATPTATSAVRPVTTPVAKPAPAPAPVPVPALRASPEHRPTHSLEKSIQEQNQKLSQILEQNAKILKSYGDDRQKFETILDTLIKMQGSISTLTLLKPDPFAGPGLKKLKDEGERIIKKTREGLATKKEVEDLRKALGKLPGKSNPLPALGMGIKEFKEEANRIIKETKSGPASKDLADLRKAVDQLSEKTKTNPQPGVGTKEIRAEVEKIVKQATSDLPTKKEMKDLHKSIENLAKKPVAGPSNDKALKKLHEDVTKIVGQTDTRLKEVQRSFEKAIAELRSDFLKSTQAGVRPMPAPAVQHVPKGTPPAEEKAEDVPNGTPEGTPKGTPAEEEKAAPEETEEDPQKKNAERIARVMVADLSLYHSDDITEGIKAGDLRDRLKKELEEMRKTFNTRVPEEVRSDKDYLKEAIDNFIERKRKDLGVE